jgi:hypothetical protein
VLADALVSIAQDSLEGPGGDGTGRTEPVVSIFADAQAVAPSRGEAGAETASGLRVGPAILEEMLCVGRIGVIATRDLEPVSYTATTRGIPPAVRRFVLHRDGGCTVAGCRSRYRLQPHHLDPYARDGDHHPDNLTTLCWYHHHVVVHRLGHRSTPTAHPDDAASSAAAPAPTRRSGDPAGDGRRQGRTITGVPTEAHSNRTTASASASRTHPADWKVPSWSSVCIGVPSA